MGYALAQGLVTACLFSYISGSPFVIQDIYKASPQTFSLIFAVNAIGIMICSQTTGRLAGKIPESTMFKFGLGMAALRAIILLILIFSQAKLVFLLIPLFFVVSSVGMVNTSGFSLAMQTQGKNAGSASALLGVTSFALGGIVSPLVGIGGVHMAIPMGVVMVCTGCGSILT